MEEQVHQEMTLLQRELALTPTKIRFRGTQESTETLNTDIFWNTRLVPGDGPAMGMPSCAHKRT
jgi:hypothetical protein